MAEFLLTVEQAAERLQLGAFTVREQLRTGRLRGIKRGRVWRIPESAIYEAAPAHPAHRKGKEQSALARAVAMVRQRDAQTAGSRQRRAGSADLRIDHHRRTLP